MTIGFRTPGELQVTMVDYLKGVMEDFPEVITGRSISPAANHLFQVRPEDERMILNKERSTASHHTMAQLLFVTSRARKDTKMAITLLCTRVSIPY